MLSFLFLAVVIAVLVVVIVLVVLKPAFSVIITIIVVACVRRGFFFSCGFLGRFLFVFLLLLLFSVEKSARGEEK